MKPLFFVLILILFTSCDKKTISNKSIDSLSLVLKNKDLKNIEIQKSYLKYDSLSVYEFSNMKKFIDSLKINDVSKYFAIRKVIDSDTLNFNLYDEGFYYTDENTKPDSEYKKEAKQILNK